MSFPTQGEIDSIREEQQKTLDRKGTVRRAYSVSDEEPVEADWEKEVPFSAKAGYGFYRQIADRFQTNNPYLLSFKWDQDIKAGDILVATEGVESVFAIRDVRDADSMLTLKRVLADRIK